MEQTCVSQRSAQYSLDHLVNGITSQAVIHQARTTASHTYMQQTHLHLISNTAYPSDKTIGHRVLCCCHTYSTSVQFRSTGQPHLGLTILWPGLDSSPPATFFVPCPCYWQVFCCHYESWKRHCCSGTMSRRRRRIHTDQLQKNIPMLQSTSSMPCLSQAPEIKKLLDLPFLIQCHGT